MKTKLKAVSKMKPGEMADALVRLRRERQDLSRTIDEIKTKEQEVKEALWKYAKANDLSRVAGKLANIGMKMKPVPNVSDWNKLYAYIKRHSEFELLQRRLTASAVVERWDAGKKIPGVESVDVPNFSVTAIRGKED